MRSLTMTLAAMLDAVRLLLRDPETRALPLIAVLLVLGGTVFYSLAEGWSVTHRRDPKVRRHPRRLTPDSDSVVPLFSHGGQRNHGR